MDDGFLLSMDDGRSFPIVDHVRRIIQECKSDEMKMKVEWQSRTQQVQNRCPHQFGQVYCSVSR